MNSLYMIGWDIKQEAEKLEKMSAIGAKSLESMVLEKNQNYVLLSTCNRIEFYSTSPFKTDNLLKPFHKLEGRPAIVHLFRVSSGIESLSLGENEILHQIKEAFDLSLKNNRTDKALSIIFRKAQSVGKKAREETGISKGKTSIPAHVGSLLESVSDIGQKRVAIIGSGTMANDLVKYAKAANPNRITVYARNSDAVSRIKEKYGIYGVEEIDPLRISNENDIIITATGSKEPIFLEDFEIKDKMFIDLGMPPNVSRKIRNNRVIYLSDIEPIMQENARNKAALIPIIEEMISREVGVLEKKLSELDADDLIKTIFNYAKHVKESEIRHSLAMLGNGSDLNDILDKLSDSIINKVLAPQTLAIKKMIKSDDDEKFHRVLEDFYALVKNSMSAQNTNAASSHQEDQDQQGQILL